MTGLHDPFTPSPKQTKINLRVVYMFLSRCYLHFLNPRFIDIDSETHKSKSLTIVAFPIRDEHIQYWFNLIENLHQCIGIPGIGEIFEKVS